MNLHIIQFSSNFLLHLAINVSGLISTVPNFSLETFLNVTEQVSHPQL